MPTGAFGGIIPLGGVRSGLRIDVRYMEVLSMEIDVRQLAILTERLKEAENDITLALLQIDDIVSEIRCGRDAVIEVVEVIDKVIEDATSEGPSSPPGSRLPGRGQGPGPGPSGS